jgi:hypothetical protein
MVVEAIRHRPSAQTPPQSSNRDESNSPETPPSLETSLPMRTGRHPTTLASSPAVRPTLTPAPSWPQYTVAPQPASLPPIPNTRGNRAPDVWQTPANSQPALAQQSAPSASPQNATQNPYYPNHFSINTNSTRPSRMPAGALQVPARPSWQTPGQIARQEILPPSPAQVEMQRILPPPPAQATMQTASPRLEQAVTQITTSQPPPPISKIEMIRPLSPEDPYEPIVSWRRANDFSHEFENFDRIVRRSQELSMKTGIPFPITIRVPACSVEPALRPGPHFPFLICHDCYGMPPISPSAASLVATSNRYPDSQHKANHKLHIWALGFVLHTGHLTFGEDESAIDDIFGAQYAIQDLGQEFLDIGSTKIGAGRMEYHGERKRCEMADASCANGPLQVLNFGARPYGFLRLLLNSVPLGDWTVAFQISTWPAKKRGIINELRAPSIDDEPQSTGRRTVVRQRGPPRGHQIGRIAIGLSKVMDVDQFFDEEEDDILKGWRHWAVNCELLPWTASFKRPFHPLL